MDYIQKGSTRTTPRRALHGLHPEGLYTDYIFIRIHPEGLCTDYIQKGFAWTTSRRVLHGLHLYTDYIQKGFTRTTSRKAVRRFCPEEVYYILFIVRLHPEGLCTDYIQKGSTRTTSWMALHGLHPEVPLKVFCLTGWQLRKWPRSKLPVKQFGCKKQQRRILANISWLNSWLPRQSLMILPIDVPFRSHTKIFYNVHNIQKYSHCPQISEDCKTPLKRPWIVYIIGYCKHWRKRFG